MGFKKGMTLIELMVAMTIFIIVVTLAIGGFVSIMRMRVLIGNMKETQQKIRVIDEMITRYAKQAERVNVSNGGKTLELYFDLEDVVISGAPTAIRSAKKFEMTTGGELLLSDCPTARLTVAATCDLAAGGWVSQGNLLGSATTTKITVDGASGFSISTNKLPPLLSLDLKLLNRTAGSTNFDSDMEIHNAILLEGVK